MDGGRRRTRASVILVVRPRRWRLVLRPDPPFLSGSSSPYLPPASEVPVPAPASASADTDVAAAAAAATEDDDGDAAAPARLLFCLSGTRPLAAAPSIDLPLTRPLLPPRIDATFPSAGGWRWCRRIDSVGVVMLRSREDEGRRHAVGSDRGCTKAEGTASSRSTMSIHDQRERGTPLLSALVAARELCACAIARHRGGSASR